MDLSIPAPATYAPASLLCNSNISNYIVNQRLLYSLSKGIWTAYPNFSIFEAQITPQLFAKRHRKKCIVSIFLIDLNVNSLQNLFPMNLLSFHFGET